MSNIAAAPGFFGKTPAFGDFLNRRVPACVRAAWEAWLDALVVETRAALGDAWPDDWLTAPLWHFVLGSSIVPPAGACGVLVASADRVGRMFPFTIIAAAADVAIALDDWSRQVEALTLGALEDDFDPDALDAALQSLGSPPAVRGAARTVGHWPLALDRDRLRGVPDGCAGAALEPPGPEQSAWWCRGSDRVASMHLCCAGLPGAATAAAMVTGEFG